MVVNSDHGFDDDAENDDKNDSFPRQDVDVDVDDDDDDETLFSAKWSLTLSLSTHGSTCGQECVR